MRSCVVIVALVAALTGGLAGPAHAASLRCSPFSYVVLTVNPGESARATLTCTAVDASVLGVRFASESLAGVTMTAAPGAGPGSFVITATAAADAAPGLREVTVLVDNTALFPMTVPWRVQVRPPPPPPLPRCRGDRSQTLLSGAREASITVSCSTPGRYDEDPRIEVVKRPRYGTLTQSRFGDGWTYRPRRGFLGVDEFTYRATNEYGSSPERTVRIRVRTPTRSERASAYYADVCGSAPSNTSCRAGRGRRTRGGAGTGKVTHKNWPAVTGVYFSVYAGGRGSLTGGDLNDEILGHHGSDKLFGGAGRDILWGDWDPKNNNGTQRDLLVGGAGTDFIYTSHGRNTVRGGTGNDFIWAFYGHGTIDCGPGIDKVRLSGRTGAYKLHSCERRGTF